MFLLLLCVWCETVNASFVQVITCFIRFFDVILMDVQMPVMVRYCTPHLWLDY
jgi:CheY-like chemotaxis protein